MALQMQAVCKSRVFRYDESERQNPVLLLRLVKLLCHDKSDRKVKEMRHRSMVFRHCALL